MIYISTFQTWERFEIFTVLVLRVQVIRVAELLDSFSYRPNTSEGGML